MNYEFGDFSAVGILQLIPPCIFSHMIVHREDLTVTRGLSQKCLRAFTQNIRTNCCRIFRNINWPKYLLYNH